MSVSYFEHVNSPIFITGATGNVGREVVVALKQSGASIRVASRSDDLQMMNDQGDHAEFDFFNSDTFAPAVAGCAAVFLLRPPAITDTRTTLIRFIDVARDLGVKQIVFVSVAGAANNPLVPHHAVEQHLFNGPGGWTILRPGFFAQNLESAYRHDILVNNRIYVPAGHGRVAFVDTRDVAAVAADALLNPAKHAGQAYTLTGSAALSFLEVAKLLTAELGRPIRYHPASIFGYVRHLLGAKLPLSQALVQAILHFGLRFGQAEAVDPTLDRLLGCQAKTMSTYIHDRRNIWLRNASA